jgi:hypothetical protein
MATRSRSGTRIVRFGAPRAVAPIIRVSAPRASPKAKRRFKRRGGGSGLLSQPGIADALGGFLVGFAVKQGWVAKLPAVPLIGRMGTTALLLGYWSKHGGGETVRRAATAAAVLSGYTLGSTGAILGADARHMQSAGNLMSAGDEDMEGDDDDGN